jgi:hypothetical protein
MLRITAEMPKTERDRISTSGPSMFSMSPNRAIASGKSNFSSPLAAAQPLSNLSWHEALIDGSSRRACGIAIKRNARPLPVVIHVIDPLGPDAYGEAKRAEGATYFLAPGATYFLAPGKRGWPLSIPFRLHKERQLISATQFP